MTALRHARASECYSQASASCLQADSTHVVALSILAFTRVVAMSILAFKGCCHEYPCTHNVVAMVVVCCRQPRQEHDELIPSKLPNNTGSHFGQ